LRRRHSGKEKRQSKHCHEEYRRTCKEEEKTPLEGYIECQPPDAKPQCQVKETDDEEWNYPGCYQLPFHYRGYVDLLYGTALLFPDEIKSCHHQPDGCYENYQHTGQHIVFVIQFRVVPVPRRNGDSRQ